MKKFFSFFLLVITLLILVACSSKTAQDTISRELNLDVSNGKEVLNINTYSGSEGTSCIGISFDDDSVLTAIKDNTEWLEFPLDETVRILIYGMEDEQMKIGPFLNDGNGGVLVPEVQNGYYQLIDRHSDTKTDILNRASFNFTVALYDTDSNTLYFCKLDT